MKNRTDRLPLSVIGVLMVTSAWGCGARTPTVEPPEQPPRPATAVSSQETTPQAVIRIDGMACPFCTYNIQRQVEALDGVEAVDVSLDRGEAYVTLSKQNPPSAEQLREAVKSAGFTARKVQMP